MNRGIALSIVGIAAFIALLYGSVFAWLITAWQTNPFYSHGILIPLITAFLLWRKKDVFVPDGAQSIAGIAVLLIGLLLYGYGFMTRDVFVMALSLLPVTLGILTLIFGERCGRTALAPIAFLVLMIPPPFLGGVSAGLQRLSADGAVALAQYAGADLVMYYPDIYIGDALFTVGIPCSGLNSLIALVAVASLVAYFTIAPYWKKAILIISAVPIAIAANCVRIALTLVIAHYADIGYATGFFHNLSGLVLFIIALALLFATCHVIQCRTFEKILPR